MNSHEEATLESTARRRAGLKLGWYIHAGVYVAVNLLLASLSILQGRHWAVFPALGAWASPSTGSWSSSSPAAACANGWSSANAAG
jgi:hypothetical protein